MTLRPARKEEASQIVAIHKKEIRDGFLSTLNPKLLKIFYQAIINYNDGICMVAVSEDEQVMGFIAGTANIKKLYFYIFNKYFFQTAWFVAAEIFRLRTVKKFIEILFYPSKGDENSKAELLTVAVKGQFQGQGIAGRILGVFVSEMKNKKTKRFNVVVGKNLPNAIKFYEKNGFEFVKKISIHSNQPSLLYTYNIK